MEAAAAVMSTQEVILSPTLTQRDEVDKENDSVLFNEEQALTVNYMNHCLPTGGVTPATDSSLNRQCSWIVAQSDTRQC